MTAPRRMIYSRAHPRSRGEHVSPTLPTMVSSGSSPLARGPLGDGHYQDRRRGLIPARAGTTRIPPSDATLSGAHPRSRGEHFFVAPVEAVDAGSSPLARGTPREADPVPGSQGLIPARAGNTSRPLYCVIVGWAHPRSRGEHARRGVEDSCA